MFIVGDRYHLLCWAISPSLSAGYLVRHKNNNRGILIPEPFQRLAEYKEDVEIKPGKILFATGSAGYGAMQAFLSWAL